MLLRKFIIICWCLIFLSKVEGYKAQAFLAFNVFTRKCIYLTTAGALVHNDCKKLLRMEWTVKGQLKTPHNFALTCLQVHTDGISLHGGDCADNSSVKWNCEGDYLRSIYGYLSWSEERNVYEITNVKKMEGRWLIYNTDNHLCEYSPQKPVSPTAAPFTRPTLRPGRRGSDELWPRGAYALPKASSGCPGSTNFTWQEGWVYQDLDDTGEIETKSSASFNMAAHIDKYGNIKRWFCTKNRTDNDIIRPKLWPAGTYCIYTGVSKNKLCPKMENGRRFKKGFASWDNNAGINNSKKKGVLPHGRFIDGGSTSLYYCCSSTRDPNIAISLPTDQAFYLLAYLSNVCQKVKWATVIPEFVVYDTADVKYNTDLHWSVFPYNFNTKDPKVYYCYYQGCNHTLTHSEGSSGEINFPESPYMDITNQSCSWKIEMPPGYELLFHVVHLNIPTANVNCTQSYLEVFEGNKSVAKYCGSLPPSHFFVFASSALLVLKVHGTDSNTTGFQIRYLGFPEERSTQMTQHATSTKETKEATTITTVETTPGPTSGVETPEQHMTGVEDMTSTEPLPVHPATASKASTGRFPVVAVVVSVVAVGVLCATAIMVVVIIKRKKNVDKKNKMSSFPTDNPGQENEAHKRETRDDHNVYVSLYESVDMELVVHPKPTQQPSVSHVPLKNEQARDINPLYESSDYSSAVNILYGTNDSCS